jgi:lipopolysaccharide/colanic/teichoic acid biosynthesis glycosyltransferase
VVVFAYIYYYNRQLRRDAEKIDKFTESRLQAYRDREQMLKTDSILQARERSPLPPLNKDLIISEAGEHVYDFIKEHLDVEHNRTLLVSTTTRFNIDNQPSDFYNSMVNLKRINNIQRINKFFESVNRKLPYSGVFIGSVTTNAMMKAKILKRFPPILNYLYYALYFLWKRLFPKVGGLKEFYFFITRGRNRALSKAEAFGRLYSCGFELVDDQVIDGMLFFSVRKIQEPSYDYNPTYGPLIRLKRVGKNGKMIYVYKMRTMHPYSEYLQGYIYDKYNLQEGGKFKNDFRISTIGRIMRKLWIDELPMLINLLRGDLKLVGVRPLSRHYFELYSEEMQQLRTNVRPGLIPPYYADLPNTLEEIQESERRYLESYLRRPFRTDWKYFWKALGNIVFKKARSK